MRVTFLNPVGVIGGAERVLLAVLRSVREQHPDFTPTVILLSDGPLTLEVEKLGAVVRVVPLPSVLAGVGDTQFRDAGRLRQLVRTAFVLLRSTPALARFVTQLRREVRASRPQIVHSNGLKTHFFSVFTRPAGAHLVWHVHDFYSHRPLIAKVLKRFQRKVSRGVAISDAVKRDTQTVLPKLPITVVPNAVDTGHFHPVTCDGRDLDRLDGLPVATSDTVRVGLIATYANWKGHTVFLEALAKLGPEAGTVRGYIIGGPIYSTAGSQVTRLELEQRVVELGLSGRVGFVPFQSDPVPVYQMLDVVVHASTRPEPFGLTIAEAMSCGKPVIVAAAGGAVELFTPGYDAIGHEPGNVAQLADAISTLTSNPQLRSQLGTNARQTAITRFSLSRFGKQMVELYQDVLAAQ